MTTPQPAALPEFTRVLVSVQGGESHSTEAQFMGDDIGYLVRVPREWQPAALQSKPVWLSDEEILKASKHPRTGMYPWGIGSTEAEFMRAARAILALRPAQPSDDDEAQVSDYQEALASVDALVRRLDVAINGNEAAPQARLCDIVSQVEREALRTAQQATPEPEWRDRLTVNLLRQGSGLTKNQIRALIAHAVDGVEPDPALFAKATPEPVGEPMQGLASWLRMMSAREVVNGGDYHTLRKWAAEVDAAAQQGAEQAKGVR